MVSIILAVTFIALFLAQVQSAIIFDRCTRTYVVKPGDICDNISAMKGVSTFQLASLNPDIDASCNNLTPGMVLCLETSNGGCPDVYIVKSHDTCDSVAAKFGISNNHLVSNNPQINSECTNIYDGEVLCVAKKHTSGGITAAVIASTSAKPSPTRTFHVTSAHPTHTSQPINEDEGDHDYLPYCDEL